MEDLPVRHDHADTTEQMGVRYRDAFPAIASLWDEDRACWNVKEIDGGWQVLVAPMLFTAAVLVSRPTGKTYEDRWCYQSVPAAVEAARAWAGPYPDTEPAGWHRHPSTGRRREHGDPATESIAP